METNRYYNIQGKIMDTNLTIEGFYAYIRSRNPIDPIDHKNYESCAIGDYYREEGVDIQAVFEPSYVIKGNSQILDILGNLGRDNHGNLETYGDLQELVDLLESGIPVDPDAYDLCEEDMEYYDEP